MRSWSLLDLRGQTLSTLTLRSRTDGETMILFPDGLQYFSMLYSTLHYFTIVFNIVQHISIHFDIPQHSNTFPSVGSKRYLLGGGGEFYLLHYYCAGNLQLQLQTHSSVIYDWIYRLHIAPIHTRITLDHIFKLRSRTWVCDTATPSCFRLFLKCNCSP